MGSTPQKKLGTLPTVDERSTLKKLVPTPRDLDLASNVQRSLSTLTVQTEVVASLSHQSMINKTVSLLLLVIVFYIMFQVFAACSLSADYDSESYYPIHLGFRFSQPPQPDGFLDWLC